MQTLRIERTFGVPGIETEEAQDAEIVFFDARVRVADENHTAGTRVVEAAARRIVDRALRVGVERVHAEVAALGVLFPRFGERDRRAAAISADVAA